MKKSLFPVFITILFASDCFSQFDAQNISFLSQWQDTTVLAEPLFGIKYQGCWGYAANGKEYGIIGSSDGTHIIDITIPANPVRVAYVVGRRNQYVWREYKTYQNYLYIVSDDGAPNSLQIMDLSFLPDSVHVVYDGNDIVEQVHTIYVDGNKLYCGTPKGPSVSGYSPMAVYDLTNPQTPQLLRKLDDDYPFLVGQVHDMFVRNDTVYASCGDDGLYIFKFETNNSFNMIGALTEYPDSGYNHSSFLTPDGKTLVFCDEDPTGLKIKTLDVTDMTDLKILSLFETGTGATPHNPYILDNKAIIAYYQDGVQIFDISNPANPFRTGYFDTNTDNCPSCPFPPYSGCWGAYTDLPSGRLLASDMQNGLFVLDAAAALNGIKEKETNSFSVNIFPNPFKDELRFNFYLKKNEKINMEIADVTGKIIFSKSSSYHSGINNETISTGSTLAQGIYLLRLKSSKDISVTKIVNTK